MFYWLVRWYAKLRKKLWRPYEEYFSDEVVAYIQQFERPLAGWQGGFVPGRVMSFGSGYAEFYVARGWRSERETENYTPPEMLLAESDDIIAREAYERMRASKLWRWRWRMFGRKSDDKGYQRHVVRALEASFAEIPPLNSLTG